MLQADRPGLSKEQRMIESFILSTSEIDDVSLAVEEITAQAESISLRSNSVGIIICHYDYVNGGALKAISEALPFPLIGITTFYQVAPGTSGLFELTITVMTSDDVKFSLAGSGHLDENVNPRKCVQDVYQKAFSPYGESPSLIFSFFSLNRPISGDEYLRLLDEASGGVPSFGAVTTGDDETGSNIHVISGGETTSYGFAMLLFLGKTEPRFYMGNYKAEKLLGMIARVTEAQGTKVQQLNEQPAVDFLVKNCFPMHEYEKNRISNVPFLYKMLEDESLIARTLGGFDDEGALLFFGEVPEKALLRVGTTSIEDILDVSKATVCQAVEENPDASVLFVFSCVGRYITLGMDPTSEMEQVANAIPGGMPYIACYVGGEVCPVIESKGMTNRFHNASFVVCALA